MFFLRAKQNKTKTAYMISYRVKKVTNSPDSNNNKSRFMANKGTSELTIHAAGRMDVKAIGLYAVASPYSLSLSLSLSRFSFYTGYKRKEKIEREREKEKDELQ